MTRSARVPLLTSLLVVACAAEAAEPEPEPAVTYYRDIKPILDAYCLDCHAEGAVGPFRLDSYEATASLASLLPESVESRQMPPFLAAPAVRPLLYDKSLSDEHVARIAEWVELGAPMGDPADEGTPLDVVERRLDRVDRLLEMPEPYAPTKAPDEYRCFVVDWQENAPRYITGVEFRPGNPAIDHHAVVYLVDEEHAPIVDAAEGADGKPGYSCFGGASPDNVEAFPTKLVAGWGPGVGATLYPEGSGALVKPGARVVLQMHYSILDAGSQEDLSAAAIRLEDSVASTAGYLPWLDIVWTSTPESMLIPAGAPEVTHEYFAEPTQSPLLGGFAPGVNPTQGLVIHSILPHMHKLGKSMYVELERESGERVPLVNIDQWDFDWQEEYVFAEPVTVLPGDRIRLSCTWDNSAENQPVIQGERREPQDVTWGEGTYDEMCASSMFVTGVATDDPSCIDVGSVPATSGRFIATFDAPTDVRESASLDGELVGPVFVRVFRADDVGLTGPKNGAEPVASIDLAEVDLRDGPSDAHLLDVELPAGDYQFLGFMDIDGNADPDGPSPDTNDPVIIPGQVRKLACQQQPAQVNFPLLLP
ncbi:MAG: hypothetical protein KC486_09800 [Myxococcales bacterium]|nr:hypothetical protein [Myxococcales bacterium]